LHCRTASSIYSTFKAKRIATYHAKRLGRLIISNARFRIDFHFGQICVSPIRAMLEIFFRPIRGLNPTRVFPTVSLWAIVCRASGAKSAAVASLFHAFIWGLKNGFICAWRRA
jgi:hypothetical protein